MAEHEDRKKRKTGLHKEISSIFEGVPIPGSNTQQPSGAPTPERAGPVSPKPQMPQTPAIAKPEPPKPSEQPLPEAASAKKPKAAAKRTPAKSRWQQNWQKIKSKLFGQKKGVSSTKQKIMLILIPVLCLILIIRLYPVLRGPARKKPGPEDVKPTRLVASSEEINWQIPEPYPMALRDPMQAGSTGTVRFGPARAEADELEIGEMSRLIVRGIVHSEDRPAAVIGTQIVHEGDVLSGVKVARINQDNVVFEMNEKSWIQKVQR